MQIDLRAMELLCSKICHDLVSPVSAINNGVELIQDIGGDVVDEAMNLIGNSGRQAADRLRMYRLAYGRAGAETNISVRDVRQIMIPYMQGGKITLNWPEDVVADKFADFKGAMKVLVNFIVVAEESLAYGGTITLVKEERDNGAGCRIEVVGRNAQLAPQYQDALEGKAALEDVTPRTIQAYISGRFAEHYGVNFAHSQPVADRLDLSLSITDVCP